MSHGAAHQFSLIMKVQFVHQVGAVGHNRGHSDIKAGSDFAGAQPLGGERKHLALAVGEHRQRIDIRLARVFNIFSDVLVRQLAADIAPP